MKTILVVGGAGYIGSHTILSLLQNGNFEKIVVFDSLINGHKEALDRIEKHTGKKIHLEVGDLLSREDLDRVFKAHDIDAVIHFAAFIEAGESMKNPSRFFENNIEGSINLVLAMQRHKVKNIVFSSTSAVYGTPKTMKVTEEYATNPENWYGYTKLVVENFLRSLATEHTEEGERINSVILRYFNAAGANEDLVIGQDYKNPTQIISRAVEVALGFREKLTIFGSDYDTPDGTCIRDYIHVADLAMGHVLALRYLETFKGSDVINLGTGKGYSNQEVIKKLEEIHGSFNYEFGDKRPGDPPAYFADNSKARKLLGFEPKYDLEAIIKTAYAWKKKYPKGFSTESV